MQYTIRGVPPNLDRALRREARSAGTSLNETTLRMLARGIGLEDTPKQRRSLRDLAGTWVEDPEFDAAIEDQHRVDEKLWR